MKRFARPGLNERFVQLGYLLKHTTTIVGRDPDILSPIIRMGIYAAIVVTVFFASLYAYAAEASGTGNLLLAAALVLFIYKFFYYNRQELALSWLVYETAAGRDRCLSDARKQVAGLRWQTRVLALLDMAAAWISSRRKKSKGGLTRVILSAMTESWDLVNHFLLPVFAIERVGFREAMGRLAATRDNVPETLMGVFGIDVLGRLVGTIVAPLYAVLALAGVVMGILMAPILPEALDAGQLGDALPPEAFEWLPVSSSAEFNWAPLLALIFVGKVFSAVFARLVVALKVIYFTLFYTRTMHADELSPEISEDLRRYLTFEPAVEEGAEPEPA